MATDPPPVSHPADGTAVFIDGDWLLVATRRAGLEVDYQAFLLFLRERFGDGSQIYLYTSALERDKRREPFLSSLEHDGFNVVRTPSPYHAL